MIETIPARMVYICNLCNKEILNNVLEFEGGIDTLDKNVYRTLKNFGDYETHHFHKSCLIRMIEKI